jgi:hypothetical protein
MNKSPISLPDQVQPKSGFNLPLRIINILLAVLFAINLSSVFLIPNELLYDFGTFVRAGEDVSAGINPYQYKFSDQHPRNLNPPVSLYVFRFLAGIHPLAGLRWLRVISLILYIAMLILLSRISPRKLLLTDFLWAMCFAGLWYSLLAGQVYVFLMVFSTVALVLFKKNKPWLGGILIGILVAFKPNFVLWPVFLLLSGAWQPALSALVTAGTLTLLPAVSFGVGIYLDYFFMLSKYTATKFPNNTTLYGIADRLGIPGVGLALSVIFIVGLAWLVWKKRPNVWEGSGIAITAVLLFSPLSWVGYTILLLPFFFSRPWNWRMIVSASLLLIPGVLVWATTNSPVWVMFLSGLIYPTALVLVLYEQIQALWKTT